MEYLSTGTFSEREEASYSKESVVQLGKFKLGKIEVVQYDVFYSRSECKHWKGVSLQQATWRDVDKVSNGKGNNFVTSKEGKLLSSINSYDSFRIWDVGLERGRRSVEYHMATNLRRMGVGVKLMDWSLVPDKNSMV